jgi:hypothetical protein
VLPITVGIRDSAVQLVSTLGRISMSKLGSIITSALPVATVLICQRACICVGVCVGGFCSVRRLVSTCCVSVRGTERGAVTNSETTSRNESLSEANQSL